MEKCYLLRKRILQSSFDILLLWRRKRMYNGRNCRQPRDLLDDFTIVFL